MQDRLGDGLELPSVLVPGAGLGRLCHDIASLGFACEVGTPPSHTLLLLGKNFLECPQQCTQVGKQFSPGCYHFSAISDSRERSY